jgi:signal transduction histidine kinase
VKFTPLGGRIHVSVSSSNDVVRISVTDTGVGVPADRRQAIFDPFVQVDTSLAGAARGTGLGLAISRNLAHAMGGDLTHYDGPEGGSVFTVTLPRVVPSLDS